MDSTDFNNSFLSECPDWFWMLLASPEFLAFETLLLQNAPDLLPLPAALDPEYLHEVPFETPRSAQGATPDPSPPHVPDPTSLPPQVTTPVDNRMSLCAVCSAPTSLPPPEPTPQTATSPPPDWHKIPQKVYDHGRKQWDYTPSERISFEVKDCPGMNMGDALRKKFTNLVGRDDLVLRDAGSVISCRLSFPEYPSNGSIQISTTRWNKERDPLTRGELAYHVARKVKQYLDAMAQGPHGSTPWKIGEGYMHLDNMFLALLESVSKGSWQPEIWVVEPSM